MINLAAEAAMTGRLPPDLRTVDPMKVLIAIAYAFVLQACMQEERETGKEASGGFVNSVFPRAWQRAEALLQKESFPVPSRYYVPAGK